MADPKLDPKVIDRHRVLLQESINPHELSGHIRCLSRMDRENLDREVKNYGETMGAQKLLAIVQRKNKVEQLVSALRENGQDEVADVLDPPWDTPHAGANGDLQYPVNNLPDLPVEHTTDQHQQYRQHSTQEITWHTVYKDLPGLVLLQLEKLNASSAQNRNWRGLAGNLGYTIEEVTDFAEQTTNHTQELMNTWQQRGFTKNVSGPPTLENIMKQLWQLERVDIMGDITRITGFSLPGGPLSQDENPPDNIDPGNRNHGEGCIIPMATRETHQESGALGRGEPYIESHGATVPLTPTVEEDRPYIGVYNPVKIISSQQNSTISEDLSLGDVDRNLHGHNGYNASHNQPRSNRLVTTTPTQESSPAGPFHVGATAVLRADAHGSTSEHNQNPCPQVPHIGVTHPTPEEELQSPTLSQNRRQMQDSIQSNVHFSSSPQNSQRDVNNLNISNTYEAGDAGNESRNIRPSSVGGTTDNNDGVSKDDDDASLELPADAHLSDGSLAARMHEQQHALELDPAAMKLGTLHSVDESGPEFLPIPPTTGDTKSENSSLQKAFNFKSYNEDDASFPSATEEKQLATDSNDENTKKKSLVPNLDLGQDSDSLCESDHENMADRKKCRRRHVSLSERRGSLPLKLDIPEPSPSPLSRVPPVELPEEQSSWSKYVGLVPLAAAAVMVGFQIQRQL